MKLSVVITTRNRKDELLKCVASLKGANLKNVEWELIVVDDASKDGTKNLTIKDLGLKNAKIIHNKRQKMMVKTRNIGAKEAKGEFVLFVDDDNVMDRMMVKYLLDGFKNTQYGVLGPSMYYQDTKKKYLDYQKIDFMTGYTKGIVSKQGPSIKDSDGVPNVFMVRKSIFEDSGYFDESLIQTFTEPDFSFRLLEKGIKSGIVSKAKVFHNISKDSVLSPRALGGMFEQKAYCLMRNRTVLVSRYGSFLDKLVYILLFSWAWPLFYSILMLRYKKFELIKLYWLGFKDGLLYFFTGKLVSSL